MANTRPCGSKLDSKTAEFIRRFLANNPSTTIRKVATFFGVHPNTISSIKSRRTYR